MKKYIEVSEEFNDREYKIRKYADCSMELFVFDTFLGDSTLLFKISISDINKNLFELLYSEHKSEIVKVIFDLWFEIKDLECTT